jgi:hypothetical protein
MASAISLSGIDVVAEREEEVAGSSESCGCREVTFAESNQKVGAKFGGITPIGYGGQHGGGGR